MSSHLVKIQKPLKDDNTNNSMYMSINFKLLNFHHSWPFPSSFSIEYLAGRQKRQLFCQFYFITGSNAVACRDYFGVHSTKVQHQPYSARNDQFIVSFSHPISFLVVFPVSLVFRQLMNIMFFGSWLSNLGSCTDLWNTKKEQRKVQLHYYAMIRFFKKEQHSHWELILIEKWPEITIPTWNLTKQLKRIFHALEDAQQ